MNTLEYYTRQKLSWDENEIQEIKSEYEEKEMTISQIGDLHYRTPGSISYKLIKIGIITDSKKARGYDEYKNSMLYKEIVETGNKQKRKTMIQTQCEDDTKHNTKSYKDNIEDLQLDLLELKKDVKKILRLVRLLCDNENE